MPNDIIVCGKRYDIGVPVVTFLDGDRYNGRKYKRHSSRAWSEQKAINKITQLLVHHSGADRLNPDIMFSVLYEQRKLSVHFGIEDDGRIYQFNDVIDQCRHAGGHNEISVGCEMCLFPIYDNNPSYYSEKRRTITGNLPHKTGPSIAHGKLYIAFQMPNEQLDALARVYGALWKIISRIRTDTKYTAEFSEAPKFFRSPDEPAKTPRTVIPKPKKHVGLIGHLQCTDNKIDPLGFEWEKFERLVENYFIAY